MGDKRDLSPEELAAVVAAVDAVWPRPASAGVAAREHWRFSGRWWLPRRPIAAGRRRP